MATLEGDGQRVTSAAWNGDESQIMITTGGGHVFLYPMEQQRLMELACRNLPSNIRWDYWRRYFSGQLYRCICPDLPPHPSVLEAPGAVIDESSCPLAAEVGSEQFPVNSEQ